MKTMKQRKKLQFKDLRMIDNENKYEIMDNFKDIYSCLRDCNLKFYLI